MRRCQYNSLDGSVYYRHDAIEPMWYRQAKYEVHGIVTEPKQQAVPVATKALVGAGCGS